MRKILLSGCNGRMGAAVSDICAGRTDVCVAAGVDVNAVKRYAYSVYADLMEYGGLPDVVIDFSAPVTLSALLAYCIRKNRPLVLATTGYSAQQQEEIYKASSQIPLFQSGNMSLGIHLLMDLVTRAASVLGSAYDIEIIEKHHNQKVDAPSGTALMLLQAVKESLPYEPQAVYDRHDRREKRDAKEIGLHAVRGGTIVGEHEVLFAGHHETITLTHSAGSREVFAAGAVSAAVFMAGITRPALYGMKDLLG